MMNMVKGLLVMEYFIADPSEGIVKKMKRRLAVQARLDRDEISKEIYL